MRGCVLALASAYLLSFGAATASACASCNCGDSTLTTTGVEQPYKNRIRLALEERAGSRTLGDGTFGQSAWTLRSTLAGSWSPTRRLTFSALLPWFTSWVTPAGRTQRTLNGLGDFELAVRGVVVRDRSFAPRHLFWLGAGLKFPTGPRLTDEAGRPEPEDDQPGSGSFDPFVLATYAWYGGLTSVFVSTNYRLATPNPRGYRRGSSLGFAAAVQLQPFTWLAISLGFEGSWTLADTLANGNTAPNSGGTLVSLAPGISIAPTTNLYIRLGASVPVVRALTGLQSEGPQVALLVAYDIR